MSECLVTVLQNFQANTDANIASKQLSEAYADDITLYSKTYIPSRRKTSMKPWITPSILCSINKKTQLYQKYLRRRNKVNEDKYKTYRNILVKTIRDAKRLYFQDALGQHRNDGKAAWDSLNQVINTRNKTTNKYPDTCYDNEGNIYREQDIPEGFSTFFSSVGQVLDRTIPKTEIDPMKYLNI